MYINKPEKVELNRRRALRIYEQVDLFYYKVKSDQVMDSQNPSEDINDTPIEKKGILESLSLDSYSKENVTLNVNISSSGLSFTSKEVLVPGDYLMIRVLLLSSMTVIMAYSRVVYCKPGNPYEKNQYPYKIGAEFVNLNTEEKTLLDQYIDNKKSRQFMVNSLLAFALISFLAAPDLVFHTVLGIFSMLFDYLIGAAHVLHMTIEYSLDHLVESVFHTGMQRTQEVAFYIQLILAGIGVYLFFRTVTPMFVRSFERWCNFIRRKKASFFYFWNEKTVWYQIGVISLAIFILFGYLLLFI